MLKNDDNGYGIISKLMHWLSAVFILPAMIIGIWFAISDLETDYGWDQFETYINWHVGFGVTAFLLMLGRSVWRVFNVAPNHDFAIPDYQATAASIVHKLMYLFAILTPLTGFLGSSLEGHAVGYFNLSEIPPFFGVYPDLAVLMTSAHFYISWSFVILLLVHLLAVCYHHLHLKHRILKRML